MFVLCALAVGEVVAKTCIRVQSGTYFLHLHSYCNFLNLADNYRFTNFHLSEHRRHFLISKIEMMLAGLLEQVLNLPLLSAKSFSERFWGDIESLCHYFLNLFKRLFVCIPF